MSGIRHGLTCGIIGQSYRQRVWNGKIKVGSIPTEILQTIRVHRRIGGGRNSHYMNDSPVSTSSTDDY